MKRSHFLIFLSCVFFSVGSFCQEGFSSESDLKERASELFNDKKFSEAEPLFAQLLSLYPKDPSYNFKYGACLLASSSDKEKPLKYLNFAASKPNTDPLAFYYLGRAHHLNYHFAKAIKAYKRFQNKVNSSTTEEYQVERKIEMCKNGNDLLSRINEVQVLEKKVISDDNFFRIYKLDGIDGKIVKKPEEFMSKYDEKIGESSIIYLPNDAREVYFSSYGKKGENRRDIYKVVKLGNGKWSEAVNLGSSINTPYDENYPFIHPDGRTLYFASEGHNSMGGYDLFMSTYDESIADWTEPINLDFAFSSVDNDVLFITDKNKSIAYFASNRTNKSGEITVYKVMVDKAPAELTVIKGELLVEGGQPPKSARVTVVDRETNQTVGSFKANDQGKYQIEIPKNGGEYKFVLETSADAPIHTGIIEVPEQDEFEVLGQELRLVGSGANQQLVIKNIFDGSKADQDGSAGPKISAELLKKKADLNVNLDADEITEAEKSIKTKDQEESKEPKGEIEKTADLANENERQEQAEVKRDAELEVGSSTNTELSELSKQVEEQVKQEGKQINAAYSIAAKKQVEAEELFKKLDETKKSADDQAFIQAKEKAELKAFDAAIALSLAQELEVENEKTKKLLSKVREIEKNWNQFNEDEGEEQLASLKKDYNLVSDEKEFILSKQKQIDNELLSAKEELANIDEGVKHISEEQARLNQSIADKRKELYQVESDIEQEQVESQLENLQLDSADLAFQQNKLVVDKRKVENNIAAFERQKNELTSLSKEVEESSTEEQLLNENEKLALKNSVKQFKDEGKIAYLSVNEQRGGETTNEDFNSSQLDDVEKIENNEKNSKSEKEGLATIESINEEYEEQFLQAKEVSKESAIAALDKWNDELDKKMIQKESRLTQTNSESERLSLQNEIDQILQQKEINSQRKSNLSSKQETVENNVTRGETGSEADQIEVKSAVETNVDVSSIDADTKIDDDFTNLNFEKEYKYTDKEARGELGELKKSLFEASDLAKKAEQAQEAAYSLPTVEERTKAFEDANAFKKASEEKLIEAATKFKEVNSKEYFSNSKTLFNANKYSENFESDNLDMANLLAEEAEVYFSQAAEVRANINSNDRFSRQEVVLQKAYDYEMMAINKQREALELLDLVDDEFAKSEELVGELPQNGTFIQTIMDPEILKISNAETAKNKGDETQQKAEIMQVKADSMQTEAERLPVGSKRDELLAEVETIRSTAEQLEKQANVYYQREAQIERGIIDGKSGEYLGKGIQTPVKTSVGIDIDTVQVDESRAEQIMQSQAYVQYLQEAKENKQLKKSAQVEYEKALDIQKEQLQLKLNAQKIRSKAAKEESTEEVERLIKEAIVLEQRAESMSNSIDSINKITRVRNYLIQDSDRNLNRQLAELDESERTAIVSLAAKNIDEPIDEGLIAKVEAKNSEKELNELRSEQKEQLVNTEEVEEPEVNNSGAEEIASTPVDTIKDEEDEVAEEEATEDVIEKTEELADEVPTEELDLIENEEPNEEQVDDTTDDILEEEVVDSPIEEEVIPTKDIRSNDVIGQIPRRLESSIFNRLNQPTSIYNRANPIPKVSKEDLPEGLVYKVQVGAFRNPIPQDMFKGFAPLSAQEGANGITRYTAGFFTQENVAISARDQIRELGYQDAFVVAFFNGERISIAKAREIENNQSTESLTDDSEVPEESLKTNSSNARDEQGRMKVEAIEGVFFTVQIGVYSKPLEDGMFSEYEPLNVVLLSNGMRRYNSGVYRTAQEAEEAKNRIDEVISDAFVTAYYQGKRITLNEAARLQNR